MGKDSWRWGSRVILESAGSEHTKVCGKCKSMIRGVRCRQIRLDNLLRYRLSHVLNVLLMYEGFFSSVVGNIRDT